MWISKKKWQELEKRIADLEGQVQSQPEKIVEILAKQIQTAKAIRPRHQE